MDNRSFFSIKFLPKDADQTLLAGRCIKVLHGFLLSRHITGIGVCFPHWNEKNIGNVIAFVNHDQRLLDELKQQEYFDVMENEGVFDISRVIMIKDDVPEVKFRRNNNILKNFSGDKKKRLNRAQKRAEERGEVFNPALHQNTQVREYEAFHSIPMSSKRTEQQFILHIQKDDMGVNVSNDFTAYGFATNEMNQGSVPDLSLII
ncbi:MAG: CRISPR-associated endonuclease Csy4 [Cocleimonas sp.]|jgi:CRISPR-associated endonuclease Csy4